MEPSGLAFGQPKDRLSEIRDRLSPHSAALHAGYRRSPLSNFPGIYAAASFRRKMLYALEAMTPPTLRLTRRALAAMMWCLAALSTTGAQEHATAPSSVPPPVRIDAVTARNGSG